MEGSILLSVGPSRAIHRRGKTRIGPAPGERGSLNAVIAGCSGYDNAELKTFVLGRLLEGALEMSNGVRIEDVSAGECLEPAMFDFRDRYSTGTRAFSDSIG